MAPNRGQGGQKYSECMKMYVSTSLSCYCSFALETNARKVLWSPLGPITIINRHAITWCLITGVHFELFVIGQPSDSHVNKARFNGFLRNVLFSFQNSGKGLQTFSLKRSSRKTSIIPKIAIDVIN